VKKTWNLRNVDKLIELKQNGYTWGKISEFFNKKGFNVTSNNCRKAYYRNVRDNKKITHAFPELKFLTIDIETAPMEVYTWGTFDQYIPNEMILKDWSILSFSAKWLHEDKVIYMDTSKQRNVRDDRKLVKELYKLLNEATVILSQNGKKFDIPKINSRLKHWGIGEPTPFQHIDCLTINRKKFKDTSNKLDFQTAKFCKVYKKSGHKKFPGNHLWIQCLAGNKEAWKEMSDYNPIDVLATEELYLTVLRKWDKTVNFNTFSNKDEFKCTCGSLDLYENGFVYNNNGKYQLYTCVDCGQHHQSKVNVLTKTKRVSLKP